MAGVRDIARSQPRWRLPGLLALALLVSAVALHAGADVARARAARLAGVRAQTLLVARDLATTIAQADGALARAVLGGDPTDAAAFAERWDKVRVMVGALGDDALAAGFAARDATVQRVAPRYPRDPAAQLALARVAQDNGLDAVLDATTIRLRTALDQSAAAANATAAHRDTLAVAALLNAVLLAIGALLLARRELRSVTVASGDPRTAALTQLARAICHDLNNILAVVVTGIELARRRGLGNGVAAHLDAALDGAHRAADLSQRLSDHEGDDAPCPVPIDPVAVLGREAGDVEHALASSWPIAVDPAQFDRAIANLVTNARDAIAASDGRITLATCDVTIDAGGTLAAGDYVAITVADNGTGMTPDIQARMFEPFFSQRDSGAGLGLGLAQVARFVREAHGSLSVTSAPGLGTTVEMLLPRSAAAPIAKVDAAPVPCGGRRILVIEDDTRVLAQTVAALRVLGHDPIACPRPGDVPELLRTHRTIDMVISDVAMPGVSGPDLVAAIHLLHPDLPTLFVTGFAGDATRFGAHPVLHKPFTIARLAEAIERACQLPVAAAA